MSGTGKERHSSPHRVHCCIASLRRRLPAFSTQPTGSTTRVTHGVRGAHCGDGLSICPLSFPTERPPSTSDISDVPPWGLRMPFSARTHTVFVRFVSVRISFCHYCWPPSLGVGQKKKQYTHTQNNLSYSNSLLVIPRIHLTSHPMCLISAHRPRMTPSGVGRFSDVSCVRIKSSSSCCFKLH